MLVTFFDLSTAFDTADHKILLKKLQYYGIKGKSLSWLQNYLTRRKQYINFEINDNDGKTELLEIICGIPQGLILGPLFFILPKEFMASIKYLKTSHVCRHHKLILFEQ